MKETVAASWSYLYLLSQDIKQQSHKKHQGQNEVIRPNNKPINQLGESMNKDSDSIKEGN